MSETMNDDLLALMQEIEKSASDPSRTTGDVQNATVRTWIEAGAAMALDGEKGGPLAGAAISGAAGGAVAAGAAAAASGAGAGGGLAAGAVAASGAGTVLAATGIGLAIVAGGALGCWLWIRHDRKKHEQELEKYRDIIKKQNAMIRKLEQDKQDMQGQFNTLKKQNRGYRDWIAILKREVGELKGKYRKAVNGNKRYRHIVGVLTAVEELGGEPA